MHCPAPILFEIFLFCDIIQHMFKLWVKQFDDNNKITKTYQFKQDFDVRFLHAYLEIVCGDLKMETPLLVTSHYVTFNNFNRVRFNQSDFVDNIDFKYFTVELLENA